MKELAGLQGLKEYCSRIRRRLHQHPELSYQEISTSGFIMDELRELGIEGQRIAGTGVYAVLDSGLPGPSVAIRADIDALPLQEENKMAYASTVPGVMHVCGHDGHTAILLGLAKVLKAEQKPGKVMLLFQPAEESPPGGALDIVNSGVLAGVNYILGSHLTNQLPLGKIGLRSGNIMASIDCFSVEITGKGGHGSTPHHCIDPIVIGAHLVTAWQTIVSRNTDPMEPVVLTTGTFKSGSNFNIIPEHAAITGSVRCLSEAVREVAEVRFEEITKGVCSALGAAYQSDYRRGYPVLTCEPHLTDNVKKWVDAALGGNIITDPPRNMWSEDFAYYGSVAPSAYFFIGARNEERGFVYENHNPRFDFDEEAMVMGIKTYMAILENMGSTVTV